MKLVAVCVGGLSEIESLADHRGRYMTGIRKRPVEGPVRIGRLGLAGDTVIHEDVHGGPDQAIYVYGTPDLAHFSKAEGRTFGPGDFGENLTVEGLESDEMCFGDRLAIGAAVIEFTAPREPCKAFGRVIGDDSFPARFRLEGRPGAYARVIAEGEVAAGDAVEHIPFDGPRIPVAILMRPVDPALVPALLQTPIHPRAREKLLR